MLFLIMNFLFQSLVESDEDPLGKLHIKSAANALCSTLRAAAAED